MRPVRVPAPARLERGASALERERPSRSCSARTGALRVGPVRRRSILAPESSSAPWCASTRWAVCAIRRAARLVAGPRDADGAMLDAMSLITSPGCGAPRTPPGSNTTIGVVATSAALTKAQANRLAETAHDGIAMSVRPAHMMGDGDTLFALSTGAVEAPSAMDRICAAAALCVARAVVRAVRLAASLGGVPSISELGDEQGRRPWLR